jgi:hypothetical protein
VFAERKPDQVEHCAKFIIQTLLPIASKHGGRVFGGFVRDIVIPHQTFGKNLRECENFKDLDLWFKKLEDLEAFAEEAKNYIDRKINFDTFRWDMKDSGRAHGVGIESNGGLYNFNMFNVLLLDRDQIPISFADFVVSEEFPVNDFDVNQISFSSDPSSETGFMDFVIHEESANPFECIKTKTCHMSEEYLEKVCHLKKARCDGITSNILEYVHLARVKRRYMDRGWTVMYGDYVFENSHKLPSTRDMIDNNRITRNEKYGYAQEYIDNLKKLL